MSKNQRQAPRCVSCERKVRPGIRCSQTFCPFEKVPGPNGHMVLGRPLRQHWKF